MSEPIELQSMDEKLKKEGVAFAVIHARPRVLEALRIEVQAYVGCESVDWGYMGGWGVFRTLGDPKLAREAIDAVYPVRRATE